MSKDLAHLQKAAPNRYMRHEKRPTEISSKTFDNTTFLSYSTQLTRSPMAQKNLKPSVSPNHYSRVSPLARKDKSRSPSVSVQNNIKSPISKMNFPSRSPKRVVTA